MIVNDEKLPFLRGDYSQDLVYDFIGPPCGYKELGGRDRCSYNQLISVSYAYSFADEPVNANGLWYPRHGDFDATKVRSISIRLSVTSRH